MARGAKRYAAAALGNHELPQYYVQMHCLHTPNHNLVTTSTPARMKWSAPGSSVRAYLVADQMQRLELQ